MLSRVHCVNEGVEGGVLQVAKNCSQILAQNYSGAEFNVPTQGPMPGTGKGPGPAGDWGVDICGSCVSMNLQLKL